jgi:hypothetical protein
LSDQVASGHRFWDCLDLDGSRFLEASGFQALKDLRVEPEICEGHGLAGVALCGLLNVGFDFLRGFLKRCRGLFLRGVFFGGRQCVFEVDLQIVVIWCLLFFRHRSVLVPGVNLRRGDVFQAVHLVRNEAEKPCCDARL